MSKDDSTWLNICYVAFALLMTYVSYKFIYTLGVQMAWIERYDEWFPSVNNIVAIALGGGAAFYLRSSGERREYHLGVISEVRKVKWPSVPDTKKMTWIVVIVVAIFSVILSAFDFVWSKLLQSILP